MTRLAALARRPLAIAGAVIATASAVVFIALAIAMFAGLLDNPYAGLVVFIAIPAVFVIGLLLIPIAMWLEQRRLRADPQAPTPDWPVVDFRIASVRRTTLLIVLLTAVNVVIILLAGYGGLHAMESPGFCGQACHTPMQPQFTALQNAAHGHIACVSCHVSEGAVGFARAKLNGVHQLVSVAATSYPRPIPPGARMPPGAQAKTCLRCHQPARPVGDRINVIREYADDEKNTETMTVLQMHVGASTASERAIHWHADPAVKVEYVATDAAEGQTIPYVKVTDAQGRVKEFRAPDTTDQTIAAGTRQTMDCIDCHNTIGHPIAQTAELAVDRAIAVGMISRDLPFVRREGIRLVKASYPSQDAGTAAIDRELRSFYQSRGGGDAKAVDRTVAALQQVYQRNVFPTMKVTWGSYPDNKGHVTSTGCFRCHDDAHEAKDGTKISGDCELCHKQIERP